MSSCQSPACQASSSASRTREQAKSPAFVRSFRLLCRKLIQGQAQKQDLRKTPQGAGLWNILSCSQSRRDGPRRLLGFYPVFGWHGYRLPCWGCFLCAWCCAQSRVLFLSFSPSASSRGDEMVTLPIFRCEAQRRKTTCPCHTACERWLRPDPRARLTLRYEPGRSPVLHLPSSHCKTEPQPPPYVPHLTTLILSQLFLVFATILSLQVPRTHGSQPFYFWRVSALVMTTDRGWSVHRQAGVVPYSPWEGVQALDMNDQRSRLSSQ